MKHVKVTTKARPVHAVLRMNPWELLNALICELKPEKEKCTPA